MIANTDGGVTTRGLGPSPAIASPPARPLADRAGRAPWTRRAHWLLRPAARPTATGSASSKATPSSNPNTSCCWPSSAGRATRSASRPAATSARPAAPRRRLGELPRRPARPQRLGQGVLRPEARRRPGRRPGDGPGPRGRSSRPAGPQACNSFTRFYLALLGQISYDDCPSVPPELVLLPRWFYFNLYAMSAWTRTIVVPLSIISAFKPVPPAAPPSRASPSCSATTCPPPSRPARDAWLSWTNFFLGVDRLLKWADRRLPASWRRPGIAAAHRWMLEHFEDSDGLGAIFPPMIYTVIALQCLGYADDSARDALGAAAARRPAASRRATRSGSSRASRRSGTRRSRTIAPGRRAAARLPPGLLRAVRWLLDKEVRGPGDWQAAPPGRRAERLVLRVPQRLLPRHRRHGDGPDGPATHAR